PVGGGGSSQLFYAPNIKGGPNTVTLTEVGEYNGAGNSYNQIAAYEYSGVMPASPLDRAGAVLGTTTTAPFTISSGTVTPRTDGELIFGFGTTYGGALSVGAGFTGRPTGFALTEDLVQMSAGPIAATESDSANDDTFVLLMGTFRPKGSGSLLVLPA